MAGKVEKKADGYGYKYANMEQIHKFIEESEIDYYQFIDVLDGVDYVMTTVIQNGNERTLRGSRVLQEGALKGNNKAQEYGSALTYARRYSLMMALGLAPIDDDGFACRDVKPTARELNEIETMAKEVGMDYGAILNMYGCKKPVELNSDQVADIKKKLELTKGGK